MRVTFLVSSAHASGGMRAVREYSCHLDERGHRVQVLIARHRPLSGRTGRPLTRL